MAESTEKKTGNDSGKIILHLLKDAMEEYLRRKNRLKTIFILLISSALFFLLLSVKTKVALLPVVFFAVMAFVYRKKLKECRFPYRIRRMARLGLPFFECPFEGKSLWVDRSGLTPPISFKYPSLWSENVEKAKQLQEEVKDLCGRFPVILGPSRPPVGGIKETLSGEAGENRLFGEEVLFTRDFEEIEKEISELSVFDVGLPVLKRESPLARYLKQNETPGDAALPKMEKKSRREIEWDLSRIGGVMKIGTGSQDEELVDVDTFAEDLIGFIDRCIPRMHHVVRTSLQDILGRECPDWFRMIHRSAFNSYCPQCNTDTIRRVMNTDFDYNKNDSGRGVFPQTTRMVLADIRTMEWECPLCRHRTTAPLALHRVYDELFEKVYAKLLEENEKDRLSVYNHINDEKRKYAEKEEVQSHEVTRENRGQTDAIQARIRAIASSVSAEKMSIAELSAILIEFEIIARNQDLKIDDTIRAIEAKIEQKGSEFSRAVMESAREANARIEGCRVKNALLAREESRRQLEPLQELVAHSTINTAINVAWARKAGVIE
jgi:hypothetical protein